MTNNPSRTLVSVFVAGLFSLAPGLVRADDWGTTGLDGDHTRFSLERSGPRFGDGRWATTFRGSQLLASPVVADGVAVVVDLHGGIHALSATDGHVIWEASAGADVQGSPAARRGRLFVPTTANQLRAYRLADGALLWTQDLGGMVLSSPTPVDDDVVVAPGLPQRHLVRLSGTSGDVVWQTADLMDEFSNTSPAVDGGLIVVGSNGGRYDAFDAATGQARWSYAGDGIVHLAAPLIWNGHVYMAGGGDSSSVHAVDAATGAALPGWPIQLPNYPPDVAGTLIGRQRAVSSVMAAGGLLLLQTRQDDALDTNGDGTVDQTLSRESVVALDPGDGTRIWDYALARTQFKDPNQVPKFFICPTPAGFPASDGSPLAAVASSLSPLLSVLDVESGTELVRHAAAGVTLASPVVANGRLVNAAMNGVTEGLLSSVNHPPVAPILAANARPLDSASVTLRWLPATDPDGELPSYELRVDSDGEVLQSWQQRIVLSAGVTSTQLTGAFSPGVTYTVALRARDGQGAYSAWSAPETFQVITNPPVQLNGQPTSLVAALSAAAPGDQLTLSAGLYTLVDTLRVGPGVVLQGAGPGRTVLDGTGLTVALSFAVNSAEHPARLDGVTVAGADTCVQIGAHDVRLSHLVVRDCHRDGVAVASSGTGVISNATLVGNGNAVHSAGSIQVKNSLLTANQIALLADTNAQLTSTYNDLFDNQTDYQGTAAGTGDLAAPVAFADLSHRDLRLTATQPSTDRGDPADDVAGEPAPNGGRVNLGAYAGTADAETSVPAPAPDAGQAPSDPAATATADATATVDAGVTTDPAMVDTATTPANPPPAPGTLPPASSPPPPGLTPSDPTAAPVPTTNVAIHQAETPEGGCSMGGRPQPSWLALLVGLPFVVRRSRRRHDHGAPRI